MCCSISIQTVPTWERNEFECLKIQREEIDTLIAGLPPIMHCLLNDNFDAVKTLIRWGADLNWGSHGFLPVLHCLSLRVKPLRDLIEMAIAAESRFDFSILAAVASLNTVDAICSVNPDLASKRDRLGNLPVFYAALTGNGPVFRRLIDINGQNDFVTAALLGDMESAQRLIAADGVHISRDIYLPVEITNVIAVAQASKNPDMIRFVTSCLMEAGISESEIADDRSVAEFSSLQEWRGLQQQGFDLL